MRAWRRWYRRWAYRLQVLGSFPTLWRGLCQVCGIRQWQAGNNEWYALCMRCLTGWSRADLLKWGPGRDRMHKKQQCRRDGHLEVAEHQLCRNKSEKTRPGDCETDQDESPKPETKREHKHQPDD